MRHDLTRGVNVEEPDETVATRLRETAARIVRSALDADRPPQEIALVAVSKTVPATIVEEALVAGQRRFGENYIQETARKWPALRERWPDAELHFVGPLQSNKARDAVQLCDVIHSLDRPSLAANLAREMERTGRRPRLLVQVNTGCEPQKGGVLPAEADTFIGSCRREYGLPLAGLMCIPPFDEPPSPHFALLRLIAGRNGLPVLSMGMSADFEAAIQLGATHVRIGTAIFGARAKRVEAA